MNTYISQAQGVYDYSVRRNLLTKDNLRTHDIEQTGMIVSAGRSTQSADQLPVTVFVVSHDEIIANGCVTLCDVLKRVPGIRVSQPQSGQMGESFIQRGLAGNTYTKILLNGVEIKPSGPEGMPLGANIPIRQAERIEVVYGPASASYGNDACSGVINIVTSRISEYNYASADIIMGDGGYIYTNFDCGGKIGYGKRVINYSIYGSHQIYQDMPVDHGQDTYNPWYYLAQSNPDGQVFDMPNGTAIMPEDMNEQYMDLMRKSSPEMSTFLSRYTGSPTCASLCNIGQQATQLGTELSYRGLRLTYNMMHRMDFSSLGITPLLWRYNDPGAMTGEYIHRVTLGGTWTLGRITTSTSILMNHYRMDRNSYTACTWRPGPQYQWGASNDIAISEDLTFKASDRLNIYGGIQAQKSGVLPATCISPYQFDFGSYKWFASSVDYTDPIFGKFGINPYTFSKEAIYLQGEYSLLQDKITITAGARLDHNTLYGTSINPRVAAVYKANKRINFRASQGYSYKEPSGANLYYCLAVADEEASSIKFEHIENPNLNPERIYSTELGLRYIINPERRNFSYIEWVMYTVRVREQLTRTWIPHNTDTHPGVGAAQNRSITRTYQNEENGEINMRSFQLIAVIRDIIKAVKMNLTASTTFTKGHELIAPKGVSHQKTDYTKIDYIRMTPKWYTQLSYDITLMKIINLRTDNIISSEYARKYYQGSDNSYFWYPKFHNMDVTISAQINKHLNCSVKCNNILNQKYGGTDGMRLDIDLPYNPQLLRNFRIAITYNF